MHPKSCHRIQHRLLPLCVLAFTGCAKISEPLPPLVLVPQPATDLAGKQYGDTIVLSVSAPMLNTDGSRVENLAWVETLRVTDDRRDGGAPLPEDVFLARAVEVSRVSAEDTARIRKDRTLAFRDDLSGENPAEIFKRAYRYGVRFINKKNQTAGLSNQVYIAPVQLPPLPTDLSYALTQDYVRLTWKPPSESAAGPALPRVLGYRVYRSEDPQQLTETPLTAQPIDRPELEDRGFQFDRTYYYAVSIIGSLENPYAETLPSTPLAVSTVDTFPPGGPENLDGIVENGIVTLLWTASAASDVAGYRVYRREAEAEKRELLNLELIRVLSYRDGQAQAGKTYEYSVTAVDAHGNEGPAVALRLSVP
jgi:hypothetical protein